MKNKASIFSSLLVLALTMLVSNSVYAQAYDPVRITGNVTSYKPADCSQDGSITIAGQTLVIAAGTDTFFIDVMQVLNGNGILENQQVKSETWQIVNTTRTFGVYLDSKNRVRFHNVTSVGPLSAATFRTFDVTGAVSAFTPATAATAGSITIHGLTFAIAPGITVNAVVDSSKLVRITGNLNSSDQLVGVATGNPATISNTALVLDAYRKLTICGAPVIYTGAGGFEAADANPLDPAGPLSSTVFVYNPLGTAATHLICDEGRDILRMDGVASIPVAPNFTSLRQDVSKDVNACFELQIDAFGWLSNGSKKISGTGNKVSGVLSSSVVQGFTGPFPTSRNEAAQRGGVSISGVTFTIAANNVVTINGSPATGDQVCLVPLIDPAGSSAPFLVGQPAPPRAGQMINGSTLTKGSCP